MNGLPVARVLGFEVRLHLSWVLILALTTVLAADRLAVLAPGWAASVRWLVGALAALTLLGSVLIHELGHGLAARRLGLPDRPITLFFFGGAGAVELDGRAPREEAAIALAGPGVSLAVGAALLAVASALSGLGGPVFVGELLLVLGVVNLLIAVVNLVPAFPLDGGRLLRAVAWAATGDERRAGRVTAVCGRLLGWGLLAFGIALALTIDTVDGAMVALSGWFLGNAGRAMERRLLVEDLLHGASVDQAMERDLPSVVPQLTLDTFADRLLLSGEAQSLPVVADRGWLGLIGISQLRRVAKRAWPTTRAQDLMVSPPVLPLLAPEDDLWGALERLRRSGFDGLPVVSGDDLIGVLTRRAAVSTIQARAKAREEAAR